MALRGETAFLSGDVCWAARRGRGRTTPRPSRGAAMTSDQKRGDHVTWNSHGGTAEGTVQRKITEDTEAAGRTVRASGEEPQYEVESGRTAVHKPAALHRK